MEFNVDVEKEEIVFSERIRRVRKAVDKVIQDKKFNKERRFIYAHLYGVAQSSAILAKKRGLNAEIAIISGMLHDIYTLVYLDPKKHAHKGAKMAMRILVDIDMFSAVEIAIIYTAIFNHSNKDEINGVYDELLKDADVLQHVMFDPLISVSQKEAKRYNKLIDEMGFKEDYVPEFEEEEVKDEISATIDEAYEELKIEEKLDDIGADIEATVGTANENSAPQEPKESEAVEATETAEANSEITEEIAAAVITAETVQNTVPEDLLEPDEEESAAVSKPVNETTDNSSENENTETGEIPSEEAMLEEITEALESAGINTELSDDEVEDMIQAATVSAAAASADVSIAEMSNSEAAKTYSRNPKQFEAVIEEINQYIEKINQVNNSIDEQNRMKELNAARVQESAESIKTIVPADFDVPESYWTDTFYFCKLTAELAELDYEAVMEAREEISRIYNITDPEEWPNASLTLEEDRTDLTIHEEEFNTKQAFAYSVFNLARKKCFGCFYISPCAKPDHDVFITLWGLNEAITAKLYKDVKAFINEKFEFKNPAFPVFEIPLSEWEEDVSPGIW